MPSYSCPDCGYYVTKRTPQGLGLAKANHKRKHDPVWQAHLQSIRERKKLEYHCSECGIKLTAATVTWFNNKPYCGSCKHSYDVGHG